MEDREAELSEHLTELRTRLIRSIIYVGLGAIAAWFLYDWVYGFLTAPINEVLKSEHTKFILTRVAEGFMIRCQVTLVGGLILALPFMIAEAWGFIAPGLTKTERRPLRWIVPLTILLFAFGVATAYFILPAAMQFFAAYVPKDAELRPSVGDNLLFVVKMLLAFGLVFEMPIALLFLGKLGIVDAKMLRSGWRFALVGIAVLAAVATPSSDAFSMIAMAIPLVFLYMLSIALVKMVEPKTPRRQKKK